MDKETERKTDAESYFVLEYVEINKYIAPAMYLLFNSIHE